MKRLPIILCSFMCIVITFCSCGSGVIDSNENLMNGIKPSSDSTYKFINGVTNPPNSYTAYKNAVCDFSFKVLASLYESGKNVAYSPAGLYTQLSLLEAGASGENRKEIKNFLNKSSALDSICESSGYFLSRLDALNYTDVNHFVRLNNNLFLNKDTTADTSFLTKNASFFNQGIFRLDFNDDNTLSGINNHIKASTDNRAAQVLNELDKSSSLTLIGTAFMKDSWLDGYKNTAITKGTFKGAKGDVDVNFMESTEYYLKGKDCQGFIKDFKNTTCRFIGLLPDDSTTAYKLVKSLDSEKYNKILKSMSVFSTCTARLPQFSISNTLSFKETLKKNNVDIMFTPEGELSGMSYNEKGAVSDIRQSFELKLTQGGVCTTKARVSKSTKKEPEHTVELSRPFVFIIADNESCIPVFAGIISNI